MLAGAGFSGFEVGLIAIALFGLLKNLPVTMGLSALILVVLIFAQYRRWIEKFDLLVISAITLGIFFLPVISVVVRSGYSIQYVALLATAAGLVAIALTALFSSNLQIAFPILLSEF